MKLNLDKYTGNNHILSEYRYNVKTLSDLEAVVSTEAKVDLEVEVEAGAQVNVSNPNDFVFDFKKNNSFNLVAATHAIEDIDIEKAKEDMETDIVLEQYKFFVQPANLGADADGTVRLKNKI